ARCRWPRWKFGTVSVRSRAALSVTVTIIGSLDPAPHVAGRTAYVPPRPAEHAGLGDRPRGDERRAREKAVPIVDADLAQPLALSHGEHHTQRHDHPLDEWPADEHCARDRTRRDERQLALAVGRLGPGVDPRRRDH